VKIKNPITKPQRGRMPERKKSFVEKKTNIGKRKASPVSAIKKKKK